MKSATLKDILTNICKQSTDGSKSLRSLPQQNHPADASGHWVTLGLHPVGATAERKKLLQSISLCFYPFFDPLIPPSVTSSPLTRAWGHEEAPWRGLALTQTRASVEDLCSAPPLPVCCSVSTHLSSLPSEEIKEGCRRTWSPV